MGEVPLLMSFPSLLLGICGDVLGYFLHRSIAAGLAR